MTLFTAYYIFCIVYCFVQLFKNYKNRYSDDPTGGSPELDSIMVVMMAWVLAPIDMALTWIKWYKKAEEARRRTLIKEQYDEMGRLLKKNRELLKEVEESN